MKVNYCLIGLTLLFSSVSMSLENREKVERVRLKRTHNKKKPN